MKTVPSVHFFAGLAFLASLVGAAVAQSPVVPKKWLNPDQLQQVVDRLQKQLDTGVDMVGTSWDLAAVKDAELMMVYVSLYEKLSDAQRAAFLKEQEGWLERRVKATAKADDGNNGTTGRVIAAAEFQSWTEKRIAELKKRLAKR